MLNKLSLEEIIALKLEVASRILGGKFYGFQLWSALPKIAKEALMLYAISASNTDSDAAELLNMPTSRFIMLKKAFLTNRYFSTMLEDYKKSSWHKLNKGYIVWVDGASFNGRTADFESANKGSIPFAPTTFLEAKWLNNLINLLIKIK